MFISPIQSNNGICKVPTVGIITTVAGTGVSGYSGDGGLATAAQLNTPWGVAVDSSGNLFISDSGNYRIRRVSSGIITTIAGTGTQGSAGIPGVAASAQIGSPAGLRVDATGNLFIADGYLNAILEITAAGAGAISVVAGDGAPLVFGRWRSGDRSRHGTRIDAAVDSGGNLYIADLFDNRIRKVFTPTASLTFQTNTFAQTSTGSLAPLTFSTTAGNTPASQSVGLTSSSRGLAFTTSTSATWLTVSPTSGVMPAVLQVSVDPTNLTAGTEHRNYHHSCAECQSGLHHA